MKEGFAEFRAAMKANNNDIKNKEPTAVKQVRVSGNRIVNIVNNLLLNLCIGEKKTEPSAPRSGTSEGIGEQKKKRKHKGFCDR
jgi:hypothetical protein